MTIYKFSINGENFERRWCKGDSFLIPGENAIYTIFEGVSDNDEGLLFIVNITNSSIVKCYKPTRHVSKFIEEMFIENDVLLSDMRAVKGTNNFQIKHIENMEIKI